MFKKVFATPYVVACLVVFGIASGAATFIESIYDVETAWKVVYGSVWYEVVMILLAVLMVGVIIRTAMYRKLGLFLFHIAFVIILIASGMTRYLGEEGLIHIREGMSEDHMITTKAYLQVQYEETILDRPLSLGQIGRNDFDYTFNFAQTVLQIRYIRYLPETEKNLGKVEVKILLNGKEKIVMIEGGRGWVQSPKEVSIGGKDFLISWGSKLKKLPFSIRLKVFRLVRYPGSQSPSSYSSQVILEDDKRGIYKSYEIYMNHPMVYQAYKFFQSSYDKDEMGTILEVNKDPGKLPTYFAYFLLALGFVLSFFTKGSRFATLREFLKNSHLLWMIIFFPILSNVVLAASPLSNTQYLNQFRDYSSDHASHFGKLLVQDFSGRVKPINTEVLDIMYKISGKNTLYGMSAEQIILGMLIHPKRWQQIEMIKLRDPNIKKLLKVDRGRNSLSFSEFFDENGYYRLTKEIESASRMPESKRGTYERDLIKLDERLNVAYLVYKGVLLKFVPTTKKEGYQWLDLNSALESPTLESGVRDLLQAYLDELEISLETNTWEKTDGSLEKIQNLQKKMSAEIIPSDIKVDIEVLYNKLDLFKKLFIFYFIWGFVVLITALAAIFSSAHSRKWNRFILIVFAAAFTLHTLALGMRWYVSGHEPWSNSYESLVYIAWSSMLAGLVVFRKSMLAIAVSLLLSGVVMLVAHLSFINPQMTNLVPVLKSYWLSIHVSVITASYGFLGLGCMLGIMSLLLMIFKNHKNEKRMNDQIRYISAINEMGLIIGLAMLTVGNFLGGVWANESWGRYWGWDPKETWALVSIVVYTVILHLRLIPRLRSIYVLSVSSVFAFYSIIMTYFGVNFYLTGMHSYAAPDANPEIPNFVYYVTVSLVMIAVFAYAHREVPVIPDSDA